MLLVGWVDGWMGGGWEKAVLGIAYSNQKYETANNIYFNISDEVVQSGWAVIQEKKKEKKKKRKKGKQQSKGEGTWGIKFKVRHN